jgi:uncharacterized delta-60 repeat protein
MSVKRFVSYVGILCLLLQFSHASNVVADGGLTPWGTSDYLCASGGFGRDIELTNDGKIYTAGMSDSGFQMVVNSTLSNGSVDTSFGSAGTRVLSELGSAPFTFSLSKVEDLLMMGDGDVVAVGYGTRSSQQDIVIVRLDSSGNLDLSFDGDGVLILAPTILDDYAYSGTVLSDGDIIIAGMTATSASNNDLYMARINSDGTLDNSFDSDGSVIIDVSGNDNFVDLAVRSDGNIAIAGSAIADPTVVVVTPTGALYTAFNDDGVSRITGLPWAITVNALSIQADGKMVFAGRKTVGSVNSHLVGRLTSNGNLDPTFNGDGLNIIEVGTPVYQGTLNEIVVQPDGKSAAIGSFFDPSSPSYTRTILFRLTSSGTLDTTLNSSTTPGYVASGLSGGDDEGTAIAVNSTGQLFTGLTSWTGSGRCVGISRYNTTLAPTTWTDESLSPALKNVAYSDTVSSNLGAAATYTLQSGTLPTGVALAANGSLSGTPTATGVFPITIRATTGSGTLDLNTTLTINQAPTPSDSVIVSTGTSGTPYSDQLAATGFPTPTYAVTSGALPTGVTLDANTGAIAGTPTVGGAFAFTITASNGIGSAHSFGSKTITVTAAPTWTTSLLPNATVGVSYSNVFVASGYPVPTYSRVSGSQPPGLNLNTNGTLSGTPLTTGTYAFVIQAQNAHGTITSSVSITVAANNTFTPVTPARVADTRNNTGGVGTTKIGNGANGGNPLTFRVLGTGNIPSTGVAAVSLNVTAVGTQVGSEGGYISVYPCANGQPDVSNLNFVNDQTVPNAVIVPVDTNGNICAYVYGKAHIIIDVNGWFASNSGFTTVTPARVADTRNNTGGVGTTKIGNGANGGEPMIFRVGLRGGIPSTGVAAVSLNVTAVGTQVGSEGGYISVYPCANGQPDVSNLNFVNDQTVPNAVIVPVDTNGNICAYVYGKAHIIIDVNGWFS